MRFFRTTNHAVDGKSMEQVNRHEAASIARDLADRIDANDPCITALQLSYVTDTETPYHATLSSIDPTLGVTGDGQILTLKSSEKIKAEHSRMISVLTCVSAEFQMGNAARGVQLVQDLIKELSK